MVGMARHMEASRKLLYDIFENKCRLCGEKTKEKIKPLC